MCAEVGDGSNRSRLAEDPQYRRPVNPVAYIATCVHRHVRQPTPATPKAPFRRRRKRPALTRVSFRSCEHTGHHRVLVQRSGRIPARVMSIVFPIQRRPGSGGPSKRESRKRAQGICPLEPVWVISPRPTRKTGFACNREFRPSFADGAAQSARLPPTRPSVIQAGVGPFRHGRNSQ